MVTIGINGEIDIQIPRSLDADVRICASGVSMHAKICYSAVAKCAAEAKWMSVC